MSVEWRPLLAALLLLLAASGCERERTPPMPEVAPQEDAAGRERPSGPE